MFCSRQIFLGAVVVSLLALAAWPVYAHCGKCASSCKDMVSKMDEGKLSLS